ncbi:MAG: hypothetical protein AAB263_00830, partial [Planctomycetota bacterium]
MTIIVAIQSTMFSVEAAVPAERLCVYLIVTSERNAAGDIVSFKCAGLNEYSQVSLLINFPPTRGAVADGFKIGPKYTNNLAARIQSPDGVFHMDFLKTTGGSALIALGKDGTTKTIDEIPKGFFQDKIDPVNKYCLLGYCTDDSIL